MSTTSTTPTEPSEPTLRQRVHDKLGERVLEILTDGRDGEPPTAADMNMAMKWLYGPGADTNKGGGAPDGDTMSQMLENLAAAQAQGQHIPIITTDEDDNATRPDTPHQASAD